MYLEIFEQEQKSIYHVCSWRIEGKFPPPFEELLVSVDQREAGGKIRTLITNMGQSQRVY